MSVVKVLNDLAAQARKLAKTARGHAPEEWETIAVNLSAFADALLTDTHTPTTVARSMQALYTATFDNEKWLEPITAKGKVEPDATAAFFKSYQTAMTGLGKTADRYAVVFEGKTVDGRTPEQVRRALADDFNTDPGLVGLLFDGRPCCIRQGVVQETAQAYAHRFQKAGAICEIRQAKAASGPRMSVDDLNEAGAFTAQAIMALEKIDRKIAQIDQLRSEWKKQMRDFNHALRNPPRFAGPRDMRIAKMNLQIQAENVKRAGEAYNEAATDVVISERVAMGVPMGMLAGSAGKLAPETIAESESLIGDLRQRRSLDHLEIEHETVRRALSTLLRFFQMEDKIEKVRKTAYQDFGGKKEGDGQEKS